MYIQPDDRFTRVPGSFVLIRNKGTYSPKVLFTYKSHLYVRIGNGFVRLRPSNKTSKDNIFWDDLQLATGGYETSGFDLVLINVPLSVVGK